VELLRIQEMRFVKSVLALKLAARLIVEGVLKPQMEH
jgi:hypothetical protein